MKGIIYTRVSSDEQVNGTSLENQDELCRKYCAQRNIEVVALFQEEGESAKDLSLNNRKKFLEALEFCRKNKKEIQAFVVLRVDRFARNTEDHFAIRKILLEFGTSLHSVTEPIGNKPAEKFIETVLAGAAEYENAIRKQRCTDGMSQKINQGIYPWKPPMGYLPAQTKKRGEKKNIADPIDPLAFPIIQRGLREYAQGLCSQADLGRRFASWGLKSKLDKEISPQMVDRMLSDYLKFYAGILYNPWTQKDVDGLHKPMITKNEYYRIKLVRSGHASNKVSRGTFNKDFVLKKTVKCALCDRSFTGSYSSGNGGRYAYYHCYNKDCAAYGKTIDKNEFEKQFVKYLKSITPKQKYIDIFRDSIIDLWKEKGAHFEQDARRYERELKQLEDRKKRIQEMREDGSYTKEEFLERKSEVDTQMAAVKISFSESKIEQFDIEAAVIYATNFISDIGRQWFDLSYEVRPRFQKLLFPVQIPYSKISGFGTTKFGLIYELIEEFRDGKSRLVAPTRIELVLPH